jgi:serine/threonine-protein kinase
MSARLSPDGRLVAFKQPESAGIRLMVGDLTTGLTRVVATPKSECVAWTPDGRRLVYQISPDEPGGAGLQWKPVDGSAPPERLTTGKVWQQPQVVTRDGRFLVYQESGGVGMGARETETQDNYDLWLLPLEPRGEPRPLLKTAANEHLAHVSPDVKWMAYASDETGRDEIWVRAFPEGAAVLQVSQDGGTEPVWAPDGRTLYYRDRTGSRVHAVPVTMGAVPQFGAPVITTGYWHPGVAWTRSYDIRPDGKALLLLPAVTTGREIRVVLNFDEVIRRKLAEGK